MPTPTRARAGRANAVQPYRETLAPALPVAPTFDAALPAYRKLVTVGSVALLAVLGGILAGLALRSYFTPSLVVAPGPIAQLYQPTLTRITQAKALAAGPGQTIQVTAQAASLQPASFQIQTGGDTNQLHPGLSAYYLQGSVGTAAR